MKSAKRTIRTAIWQLSLATAIAVSSLQTAHACGPSYSNAISADETYVYATTSINVGIRDQVVASVYLNGPGTSYSYEYGTPQWTRASTSTQLAINGNVGNYENDGTTADITLNQDYTPAAKVIRIGYSGTNYKFYFEGTSSCVYSVDCDATNGGTPTCGMNQGYANVTDISATAKPCGAFWEQQFEHIHYDNGTLVCTAIGVAPIPPGYPSGKMQLRSFCD